jgi:myo-inositol 2-dehydrogenase/D-chiro-inositol 1-dehydrogenase
MRKLGKMEKIKLGIVGLGRLGKRHAEDIAFRIPNAELTAVCCTTESKINALTSEWGVPYGYTDFNKMIENKEIDGILIASSSTEHCKQAVAALDAGFHVYCEKPLGLNVEECKYVEKAVERHPDKVFSVGFMNRYDRMYQDVKKKIDSGYIGTPVFLRCYRLDPKKYVQSSITYSNKSGGLFFDVLIHDMDIARWFLKAEPVQVSAVGGCFGYKEFAQFNDIDNGSIHMQFSNGAMAIFYTGRTSAHGYHVETEIIGTEGSLRIGHLGDQNAVTVFKDTGALKEFNGWFIERYADAFLNEKQEFADCIEQNRKPEVTVYDATRATEIVFAANKALQLKQTVSL